MEIFSPRMFLSSWPSCDETGGRANHIYSHSGLGKDFRPIPGNLSVTLSIGTPLNPYDVAYRRAHG